jgi:beta-lactamase regulating signal transducer with metallopeptidase domain
MSERLWSLIEIFGHWSLAWSVVVGLILLWLRVARPRRAAVRYAGWLLATFAGLALLPVVVKVDPRTSWREILAAVRPTQDAPHNPPALFRSWFDGMPASAGPRKLATIDERGPDHFPANAPTTGARQTVTALTAEPQRSAGELWLLIALLVWAAGVAMYIVRLARSVIQVRVLVARLNWSVPLELTAELETLRAELGIRRGVRLAIQPEIAAPMCVGLIRPIILWPAAENCPMSLRQQRASLTHELAHLRHADDWVLLVAELWRALSWFFLPVHFTLVRARRECEFRCDDLAAAKLETPERYAAWLLDLAPVRVVPPLLVSSLTGGVSVADRVRRIAEGELRWAKPLARRQLALMGSLAIVLVGGAASVRFVGFVSPAKEAGARTDAPLPDITPQELGKKMRSAWEKLDYGLLEVEFDETRNMNWRPGAQPAGEKGAQTLLTFPGRARCAREGQLWRIECDSMMPNSNPPTLVPDRWSTGFDGEKHYDWQIDQMYGLVVLGQIHHVPDQWTPRQLFSHQGDSLIEFLETYEPDRFPYVISQRVVEDMPCYVFKGGKDGGDFGNEIVIAPTRGYLCLRSTHTYKGRKQVTHSLHEVREVAPEVWAPGRIEYDWFDVDKADSTPLILRRTTRVKTYEPRKAFAPGSFAFQIPSDVDVTDRRLGYSYHTDPWWPEVGALLRERFDWPKPFLQPLKRLSSPSQSALTGKPAPPIRAASWVNSTPRDLGDMRGKVVMLAFWDGRYYPYPELMSSLRRLHEIYGPAGLEMISIHAPIDDTEVVRQFVHELGIRSPVAIDQKGEHGRGATATAYGTEGGNCAFLVDQDGKTSWVGQFAFGDSEQVIEALLPLLRTAGAPDAKPVKLEPDGMSRTMTDAVETLFRQEVEAALADNPHGSISGRVVDGAGNPIEGATVKADLNLTLLSLADTGIYYLSHYPSPPERCTATTGPDGGFTLPKLCKGTYTLKALAEGKARVESRATIAADQKPVTRELVLDQGDSIFGMVQDEDGRPLPGASITPTQRQFIQNRNVSTTAPFVGPVRSDVAGLFRFSGLMTGSYSFEVSATGFEPVKLERIAAGSAVDPIRLKRAVAR